MRCDSCDLLAAPPHVLARCYPQLYLDLRALLLAYLCWSGTSLVCLITGLASVWSLLVGLVPI